MNNEVEMLKKKDITNYIEFINDVFGYKSNKSSVEQMMKENKILIIKNNNKIVASVVLEERQEYIKCQKYYFISYLGVLKEERRMGYASKLFDKINELAKENEISYLELTSGNQRRAAHHLYQSEGFKIKDTSVFIKIY